MVISTLRHLITRAWWQFEYPCLRLSMSYRKKQPNFRGLINTQIIFYKLSSDDYEFNFVGLCDRQIIHRWFWSSFNSIYLEQICFQLILNWYLRTYWSLLTIWISFFFSQNFWIVINLMIKCDWQIPFLISNDLLIKS